MPFLLTGLRESCVPDLGLVLIVISCICYASASCKIVIFCGPSMSLSKVGSLLALQLFMLPLFDAMTLRSLSQRLSVVMLVLGPGLQLLS